MSTSAGPSNVRRTSSGGFASDDSVGAVRRGRGKGRVEESESDLSEVEGDDSGEYVGGDGSDEESGSEGDEDEGVEGEDATGLDTADLVGDHEEVLKEDVSQPQAEHPLTTAARNALVRMYLSVKPEIRQKAGELYPWVFNRLRDCEDFDTTMRAGSTSDEANHTSAPSLYAARPSALHPVSLSVISIEGKQRSGVEMVLAVGLGANPKLIAPMEEAALVDMPLDVSIVPAVSQGNARESEKHGVYFLKKNGQFIVGRVTVMSFRKRLSAVYRKTGTTVIAAFGKGIAQRQGRKDNILIDLTPIDRNGPHVRWVCATLETIMIAGFASNVATRGGLNTNTSDFTIQHGGRSFTQLRSLWGQVKKMLDEAPDIVLPASHKFGPFFESCLRRPLEAAGFQETANGLNWVIRNITPLAHTGKFPHFPPLRHDAFMTRRPYLPVQGRKAIVPGEVKLRKRHAPIDSILNPPIPAEVKHVLTSIPTRSLLAFEKYLPTLELGTRVISNKRYTMKTRMTEPLRRSTRDKKED